MPAFPLGMVKKSKTLDFLLLSKLEDLLHLEHLNSSLP